MRRLLDESIVWDNHAAGVHIMTPEQIPEIAETLERRGWNEMDIRGLLGLNNLRVAEQVWK